MNLIFRLPRFASCLFPVCLAAACASSLESRNQGFTPIGQCEIYEGQGETTEYTVEIAESEGAAILGIQGFHPNDTSPERIVEVRLVGIAEVKPKRLSNDCVCGVQFARSSEMCAYVSTYTAPLKRAWLEDASKKGLNIQFVLENGLVVAGPSVPAKDISAFLTRRD